MSLSPAHDHLIVEFDSTAINKFIEGNGRFNSHEKGYMFFPAWLYSSHYENLYNANNIKIIAVIEIKK